MNRKDKPVFCLSGGMQTWVLSTLQPSIIKKELLYSTPLPLRISFGLYLEMGQVEACKLDQGAFLGDQQPLDNREHVGFIPDSVSAPWTDPSTRPLLHK